jgi:IS30 family transposase
MNAAAEAKSKATGVDIRHPTEQLNRPAAQLNNRPRKTLKFKTPKEIFESGVALTY